MNRRQFWTYMTGGLMGTRLGWFKDVHMDVVGVTSDIDLSRIDLKPLIESFKKFTLETEFTTKAFNQIRKDICASPVLMDLEEDDVI